MPQKRDEVVQEVESSKAIPDVYETWLKKQVKARSGSIGVQDAEEAERAEAEREEGKIDRAEDLHEKAHRRKRGRSSH